MEHKLQTVSPEIFMDELTSILNVVEAMPLVISGNSMLPFLVHGRDTVYLSRLVEELKKGDIILYRRADGSYILHRIYKIENGNYSLIGDAQPILEKNIKKEQIIAKVTKVKRKGRILSENHLIWLFFRYIWLNIIPLRGGIIKICSIFKRMH